MQAKTIKKTLFDVAGLDPAHITVKEDTVTVAVEDADTGGVDKYRTVDVAAGVMEALPNWHSTEEPDGTIVITNPNL